MASFADNALGLFALGLRFNLDDLESVEAEAITDGSDDKKCDIVYVDPEEDFAVIMQCYMSAKQKASAPANKASDLNTALNWLLSRKISELPDKLQSPAYELREGLTSGRIRNLHIWYTYNLPASTNARNELATVEHTASHLMRSKFPDQDVKVSVLEVGSEQLAEWYNDTQSPILVSDEFSLDIDGGFEIFGDNWKAFVTTMPLQFLRSAYKSLSGKS